ncbi:MAG: hypothetical protein MUC31_08715 [Bacteroidales bacterium]|nr:hypothetical protein [Bacteroidales bacterium]
MKYFDDAGVKEQTESKIQEHYEKAGMAFDSLNVPEENKMTLRQYTQRLMARSY